MKITKTDKTLTIVPNCDLIASQVEKLRDAILNKLKKEKTIEHIVFDAKGIEVVDSLGVNLIIGAYRQCESQSISFELVNANEKFTKVSDFFQFKKYFKVSSEN